jgi:hypothetical protein
LESSKAREEERERKKERKKGKKERKKERARGEHLEDIIYILYIHVVCTQILDRWRMVDRWNIGIQ